MCKHVIEFENIPPTRFYSILSHPLQTFPAKQVKFLLRLSYRNADHRICMNVLIDANCSVNEGNYRVTCVEGSERSREHERPRDSRVVNVFPRPLS